MTDDQTRSDRSANEQTVVLGSPDGAPRTGMSVLPDPRVEPYLQACRAALADLPPAERAELLEDLAAHLEEIAAEEGDALGIRLGAPQAYAEEFRASAGYPAAGAAGEPKAPLTQRVSALVRSARPRTVEWIEGLPGGATMLSVLGRLRPAWWVIRGWIAAYLLAGDGLLASLGFGRMRTFLALVVCIGASVAWGMRAEGRPGRLPAVERLLLFGVNAVAVLLCLGAITQEGGPLAYVGTNGGADLAEPAPAGASSGLSMGGQPITNLTAYDLEGNPIPAVQLYDQDGNRVVADVGSAWGPDGETLYALPAIDSNGYPVPGVFPVTFVMTTSYLDENTGSYSLQVSRVKTASPAPALSGLTAATAPAVGSVVPVDENGDPLWAQAYVPGATGGASPSPSAAPSDNASPSAPATNSKDAKGAAD